MDIAGFTTKEGITVPVQALLWSFSLASGPGGQNVNKVSSKATLQINLLQVRGPHEALERVRAKYGETIKVSSATRRTQLANRKECLAELRRLIEAAEVPPPPKRKATKPSPAATERRLQQKQARSTAKANRKPPTE